MLNLKRISAKSTGQALDRAERYRLLNEPQDAESICLDVLEQNPGDERARVILLLSLTDQFDSRLGDASNLAMAARAELTDPYARAYYEGIICERMAKAHIRRGGPHSGYMAYDLLAKAMEFYAQAETIRPPDNDEAILRWNSCVRILRSRSDLVPDPAGEPEQMLE